MKKYIIVVFIALVISAGAVIVYYMYVTDYNTVDNSKTDNIPVNVDNKKVNTDNTNKKPDNSVNVDESEKIIFGDEDLIQPEDINSGDEDMVGPVLPGTEDEDEVSNAPEFGVSDSRDLVLRNEEIKNKSKGACNFVVLKSFCVEYTGGKWDDYALTKAECQASGGSFMTTPCPRPIFAGCMIEPNSEGERVEWYYSGKNSPYSADSPPVCQ